MVEASTPTWVAWVVCLMTACSSPPIEAKGGTAAQVSSSREIIKDAGIVELEALHQIEEVPIWGEPLPSSVKRVTVDAEGRVFLGGRLLDLTQASDLLVLKGASAWFLETHPEVYMAQLSHLFAIWDDAEAFVWLRHSTEKVAFRVELKDEAAFQSWLEAPIPGRIRVIQRADGLELSTVFGKVVGGDAEGPSVPNRGGQWDLARARSQLQKLRRRFTSAEDIYFVPSSGTEVSSVTHVMSANYSKPREAMFPSMSLVYRRIK